jgi:long-chain fatty acid transport protein
VAAEPVDGLELMAGFTWTDDVRASGDLNLRPVFWGDESAQQNPPRLPADEGWEDVTYPMRLHAPQMSVLSFGGRYAFLRPGARRTSDRVAGLPGPVQPEGGVERTFDPLRDEVFDVELDVVVSFGKRVDTFRVTSEPIAGQRLVSGVLTLPGPPDIELPHNWRTQVSIALGGDVNVLPEVLALRWGVVYETHGVQSGYERLDFTPWELLGGSVGLTARIQRFELSLGYMYIHYFTINHTNETARLRAAGATGPGMIINAGRFTTHANLLSVGLSYRFR